MKGFDQGTMDITVTRFPDQGFRAFSELSGKGFGLCPGRLYNPGCHGIVFQDRGYVLRVFQQPDSQVAVVVTI